MQQQYHFRSLRMHASGLANYAQKMVFRNLAYTNNLHAAAILARLSVRCLHKPKKVNRTVVVLPKDGFTEDALASLIRIGDVKVLALPRAVFKSLAAGFLPYEVDDNNYISTGSDAHESMARYRASLKDFWRAFDPKQRIDAVMTGNFAYYAERELAAALEEMGVPLIVLHKENTKGPGGLAFWERVYRDRRGPFRGRRLLVYNPVERDVMIRAGVVGPDRVEVVGMPRLDEVHAWRRENAGKRPESAILFASFQPDVTTPVLARKGHRWRNKYFEPLDEGASEIDVSILCRNMHLAIKKLAASHPDIQVWVKTKGRERDRQRVLDFFEAKDPSELPPNLTIVHGSSPLPYVYRAAAVCGFNTTLLLEGLAAGRPVVVPDFDEASDPRVASYVFDVSDAAIRAKSPDAMIEALTRLARDRIPVPEALDPIVSRTLYEWLGNDDGRAGERAAEALRKYLPAQAAEQGRGLAEERHGR